MTEAHTNNACIQQMVAELATVPEQHGDTSTLPACYRPPAGC
jgi:hypothetical protein